MKKATKHHAAKWPAFLSRSVFIEQGCNSGSGVFNGNVMDGPDSIIRDAGVFLVEKEVDKRGGTESAEGHHGGSADRLVRVPGKAGDLFHGSRSEQCHHPGRTKVEVSISVFSEKNEGRVEGNFGLEASQ